MSKGIITMLFNEVLDIVDELPWYEQETLVDIVQHRLAAQNRHRLVADIMEARAEFASNQCQLTTATDLILEILA